MLPMNWMENATQQLQKGAFLMVGNNPMTIGWAHFGTIWGRKTAVVYVRHSRYTHDLLENSQYFTISVPSAGTMAKELSFCGIKSGRDVNKLEALDLTLIPAKFGGEPGLKGCAYHVECRILHRCELPEELIEEDVLLKRFYPQGDTHTQYIAEVMGVYEE